MIPLFCRFRHTLDMIHQNGKGCKPRRLRAEDSRAQRYALRAQRGKALLFRFAGVFLCTLGTRLNLRERLFCMAAYMPKATVQAAIGGVPLAMGLSCGATVLSGAVLAILVTATLGAFLIELTAPRLLTQEKSAVE